MKVSECFRKASKSDFRGGGGNRYMPSGNYIGLYVLPEHKRKAVLIGSCETWSSLYVQWHAREFLMEDDVVSPERKSRIIAESSSNLPVDGVNFKIGSKKCKFSFRKSTLPNLLLKNS